MSFKFIIGVLFGLLVTAISILGYICYRYSQAVNITSRWLTHTHKIIDQVEKLSALYKNIQLESNSFYVTHDTVSVKLYWQARKHIASGITSLRSMTRHNPSIKKKIDSLELLMNGLFASNDSIISATVQEDFSKKGVVNRLQINRRFRKEIQGIINEIRVDENKLLAVREFANKDSIAAFYSAFFLMLSGVTVLVIVTFFSTKYNFDKRLRLQQELKLTNELFSKLFYQSHVGVAITRLHDGAFIDCNQAYADLINYEITEIIGKTAVNLGILESQEQRNDIFRKVIEQGIERNHEIKLKPRGSEPIWVSTSLQTIQIQEENCLMSVVLDMTVHKEAEQQIKNTLEAEIRLNKMKSDFVTLASHEFRTPLTTILSSAFLLESISLMKNPEGAKKHITRIRSSVNLLTSILDEFLSLSKIEEGKTKPILKQLDVKGCLEEICSNARNLTKPGQQIKYRHTGESIVYSDPILLGNIVNNLISNAIKYSPPDTLIYVSSEVNARLHVTIKDSGIGIPAEDQKNLFERFYRASNAGNVQGTGLGLHIMKHYVDMLRGSIKLTSEPGKGTEFQLTFEQQLPESDNSISEPA